MSQVIRHVRSWTSLPTGLRKGGHRKGFSLIEKYRHDTEDEVQWEMMAIQPLTMDLARKVQPSTLWYMVHSPLENPLLSPWRPPAAPYYSDMRLPFELWDDIFKYLDDGHDIYALARVCKGLRDVSREAKGDHAMLVRRYKTVKLTNLQSILNFLDLVSASPKVGFAVLDLTVTIPFVIDRDIVGGLVQVLSVVPNTKRLSLQIQDDDLGWASHTLLRSAHLPMLRVFATSLPFTAAVARFVKVHLKVEDISLSTLDATNFWHTTKDRETPPSSLRTIACDLRVLQRFRPMPSLTHLHVLVQVPQTLETICSLFGRQLISLRLGVLDQLPDLHTSPCPWSTYDILTSFPRLKFIQIHMFEPDFVPQPIHWQDKRDKALQLSRPDALTVAWVLEEQAWGTILEHPDDVRQLFDEAASEVLRQWAPYVDRVVYGDAGVLDTSVRFGKDGTFEILRQDELLGEDHWRKV